MKKIAIILMLFVSMTAFSAVPQTISWQGILQDSQGKNLNGTYSLTVKLFNVETVGTALWTETHQDLIITDGFVHLVLGEKTALNISFDQQLWLEITVGTGTPLSRIKITSVPYSLYSQKSSSVIIGDSLVLKDSQGVTRFVLNPNTGTFKMMNKDTVWYSLEVNSPPKLVQVTSDGGERLIFPDGEQRYNAAGELISELIVEVTGTGDNEQTTETQKFYNNNTLEQELIVIDNKNGYTETEIFYDNGLMDNERTTSLNNKGVCETFIMYDTSGKETLRNKTVIDNDGLSTDSIFSKGSLTKVITRKPTGEVVTQSYDKDEVLTSTISSLNGKTKASATETGFFQELTPNGTAFGQNFETPGAPKIAIVPTPSGSGSGYQLGMQFGSNPTTQFIGFDFQGNIKVQPTTNGRTILGSNTDIEGNQTVTGNIFTNGGITANGNTLLKGTLQVNGTKNFLIDYPEDPYNKYLSHASIESNEVLNKYSGVVVTNNDGIANVALPSYFELINKDFRYQLTAIGKLSHAYISKEISNNNFEITTDVPNVKISWEVTATRNDEVMKNRPFKEVYNKEPEMKGKLLFTK